MAGFLAVFLREMVILRRRFARQLAAAAVSPLLYLLAFGHGLGGGLDVDGRPYIRFLLPGLIAMASMTQAFGIAGEINIARFYSCVFEEIQASPASRVSYVMGEVCAALARALLGSAVVILLGLAFGVHLSCGLYFWLGVLMNGFAFAALAVSLAMVVKSHADQSLLNTFVITPMAFLGGTFFPMDKLPAWAGKALSILPLTHASHIIRAGAFGLAPSPRSILALGLCCCLFLALAVHAVGRARD